MNQPNGAPPIPVPAAVVGITPQVGHKVDGGAATIALILGEAVITFPLWGAIEVAGLINLHACQAQAKLDQAAAEAASGKPRIHVARTLPKMRKV